MLLHPNLSLLSGVFPRFVHKRVKPLESVTPRKTSFILVSEALSCHRPHGRVIKQEMSCIKLPGMQVRRQHQNGRKIE